jgi:hypothetical protein
VNVVNAGGGGGGGGGKREEKRPTETVVAMKTRNYWHSVISGSVRPTRLPGTLPSIFHIKSSFTQKAPYVQKQGSLGLLLPNHAEI